MEVRILEVASNFLSILNQEALQEIMDNPEMWQTFLKWEVDFCKEPGAIDAGTHMIVVVQRA